MGVKKIEMAAGLQVGPLAWAKLGLKTSPESAAILKSQYREFLVREIGDRALADRLSEKTEGQAAAIYRSVDDAGRKWGREFLLEKDPDGYALHGWEGYLPLIDGDPNFELVKKVLGL
jgi:hypothetical protein